MKDDDTVYRLCWGDVHSIAVQNGLPEDLTYEEMHVFRKCLEAGMGCWAEVVQLALAAATVERHGAGGRLKRFVESDGDTSVLLEGLDP
jgi:hypothetical protein